MAAKLRVTDPNGKLVFDSSKDRVMSFLKSDMTTINFPTNGSPLVWTYRITHPRITPERGFVYAEFYSIGNLQNSIYGSDLRVEVVYGQGYADVIFPRMSIYPNYPNSLTYKIKAYTL